VLLDVPAYDFNWQHRYEMAEPKRLPAGTVVRCAIVYDNSAGNPFNPDPTATVRAGPQSWDEMFNGYFDIAPVEEGVSEAVSDANDRSRRTALLTSSAAVGVCCVWLWRRKKGGSPAVQGS
jgi:hypothetical protein